MYEVPFQKELFNYNGDDNQVNSSGNEVLASVIPTISYSKNKKIEAVKSTACVIWSNNGLPLNTPKFTREPLNANEGSNFQQLLEQNEANKKLERKNNKKSVVKEIITKQHKQPKIVIEKTVKQKYSKSVKKTSRKRKQHEEESSDTETVNGLHDEDTADDESDIKDDLVAEDGNKFSDVDSDDHSYDSDITSDANLNSDGYIHKGTKFHVLRYGNAAFYFEKFFLAINKSYCYESQLFKKHSQSTFIGIIKGIMVKRIKNEDKLYFQFCEYTNQIQNLTSPQMYGYALCSEFMSSQSPVLFLNNSEEITCKSPKTIRFVPDGNSLLNRRIRKKFLLDNGKEPYYDGKIISYNPGIGMYEVEYSDGERIFETARTINDCLRLTNIKLRQDYV